MVKPYCKIPQSGVCFLSEASVIPNLKAFLYNPSVFPSIYQNKTNSHTEIWTEQGDGTKVKEPNRGEKKGRQ